MGYVITLSWRYKENGFVSYEAEWVKMTRFMLFIGQMVITLNFTDAIIFCSRHRIEWEVKHVREEISGLLSHFWGSILSHK